MPTVEQITLEPAQPAKESSALTLKTEDTRSHIAKVFTYGYLGIILLLIILTTRFNLSPDTAKDYLLSISGVLGFVIGYYFKSAS